MKAANITVVALMMLSPHASISQPMSNHMVSDVVRNEVFFIIINQYERLSSIHLQIHTCMQDR